MRAASDTQAARQYHKRFKGLYMHLEDTENLPTGMLEVAIFKNGQLFDFWKDQNLVVNEARTMLAQLVAGDSAGSAITKIGFGVGSTPADPDDTSLSSAYVRNLTGHSYPEAGKVRFEFALNTSEANGLTIREFGLITADNRLFSRKVRGGIEKNDDISLEGVWTITF